MGTAILRRQYVPQATGGTFGGDITVAETGVPVIQTNRTAIVGNGSTIGNFRNQATEDDSSTNNFGILRCIQRDNAAGAARSDYEFRCLNGSGSVTTLLVASGQTEDGGGCIKHKTKASAIALADVPTGMMMCCNDGTDIGIYLNDGGVLKKLQSTGLFT